VAIDESAAIAISGETYVTLGKGMKGMGTGVYTMKVSNCQENVTDDDAGDQILIQQAPPFGKLSDLVQKATFIKEDEKVQQCREENPDDEIPPDEWWTRNPQKEQSFHAFVQMDTDASLALDAKELALFFGISMKQALFYIEKYGIATADGVLHPQEFVDGLVPDEPMLRRHGKWGSGDERAAEEHIVASRRAEEVAAAEAENERAVERAIEEFTSGDEDKAAEEHIAASRRAEEERAVERAIAEALN